MDRFKKLKKEKSAKCSSKDQPLYITDIKSFKENIKIKEILRTVKMNSSMRLKAPPGSKVMSNTDFNDEDCFEESSLAENSSEVLSATNPVILLTNIDQNENETVSDNITKEATPENENGNECNAVQKDEEDKLTCNSLSEEPPSIEKLTELSEPQLKNGNSQTDIEKIDTNDRLTNGKTDENLRDRKLSLDHTVLSRGEGLSNSEIDLNSVRKCKLERKSSFFRKTMDSFVKNTTEMFKRQNKSLQRHVSMSVSLQSLSDKSLPTSNSYSDVPIHQKSGTFLKVNVGSDDNTRYLQTPTCIARSNSSLSCMVQSSEPSPADSYAGSQPNLEDLHSSSVHSLNEACLKNTMPTRAISMSSGLDSPYANPRRKASRSNRVTWVASEGLTNYLRRVIQDEKKKKEMQSCQSYQDFSRIPENGQYIRKPDTKGRRLSYQRAVSGEDPVLPTKYYPDTSSRRKDQISEACENNHQIALILTEYSVNGIPTLQGYEQIPMPYENLEFLRTTCIDENVDKLFQSSETFTEKEKAQHEVIKELIISEAEHISNLMVIMDVFLAAAHGLQERGTLLSVNTKRLFGGMPDILNASLHFWNTTIMPMVQDAIMNRHPPNVLKMSAGFAIIHQTLASYETYLVEQGTIVKYFKNCQNDNDFKMFTNWCKYREECKRLEFTDFLAKPVQRVTKYSLLLSRLKQYASNGYEYAALEAMDTSVKIFLNYINKSVRQFEEFNKLTEVQDILDAKENELKDENVDKEHFKLKLMSPMLYCEPHHYRNLIHEAHLRFRDGQKEMDVHALLFTDCLLICKPVFKRTQRYRLARPVFMIDKLIQISKSLGKTNTEPSVLSYVSFDDLGTATSCFTLSESSKETDVQHSIKTWEYKMYEAKLTYEILIWTANNPNSEISDEEVKYMMKDLHLKARTPSDEEAIQQQSRTRAAAVAHRRSTSRNYEPEYKPEVFVGHSARLPDPEEPEPKLIFLRLLPVPLTEKSSTVDTTPPCMSLHLSESSSPETEESTTASLSMNKIQLEDNAYALPEVVIQPTTPRPLSSGRQPTASESLYRYHQDVLKAAGFDSSCSQQWLEPDNREFSFPSQGTRLTRTLTGIKGSFSAHNIRYTAMSGNLSHPSPTPTDHSRSPYSSQQPLMPESSQPGPSGVKRRTKKY